MVRAGVEWEMFGSKFFFSRAVWQENQTLFSTPLDTETEAKTRSGSCDASGAENPRAGERSGGTKRRAVFLFAAAAAAFF